ncbi:apoptosis regulator R1-like isoform X2 [Anneissia japonica]|uniref:apoptosis regulator R1-like isoform X2 n=1 Tax=Anneissia japonica TaxID=1529436 RepID=UPI0014257FC5|nr:apoptosis regulator R1-like isoform X2 [Anneissia japonica]
MSEFGKMNDSSTSRFVRDYVVHRIRQDGITIPGFADVSEEAPCDVTASIRRICHEIEESQKEFFGECCHHLNISPTTLYAQFMDLASELFKNPHNGMNGLDISWGRIATFLTFCGTLGAHCAAKDLVNLVPSVIGWTVRYIDQHLNDWMTQNNGWAGFVEFFRPRPGGSEPIVAPGTVAMVAAGLMGLIYVLNR